MNHQCKATSNPQSGINPPEAFRKETQVLISCSFSVICLSDSTPKITHLMLDWKNPRLERRAILEPFELLIEFSRRENIGFDEFYVVCG